MKNLQLASIFKRFGAQEVLRDVRLEVASGEFVTLLGPSGCGKTTLLRIIAGLELPDSGSILLGGEDIGALPANRRPVNTVFQNYALFPHLDVFDNVAFGLRSRGVPPTEIQDRATRAMEMLQLESFARRGIHQLSGGQKQRVALARALVNEPDVLLLDEPMSALDAKLRAEVQLELRRLQRKLGKTFILVTHDQDEAITVSDRIMVMREGKIEQTGAPEEVYERPVNRFVAQFLGAANIIGATRIPGEDRAVLTEFGEMTLAASPAWEKGSLAVRPERIRISAERPPSNAVRATVREVVYRGDHIELFLDPGMLRVRSLPSAHAGVDLKSGAEIWLEFPVDRIQILAD